MNIHSGRLDPKTLLMVDCDERTEAMLTKSINRLGIDTESAHHDSVKLKDDVIGLIIELDNYESPELVKLADRKGLPIIALTRHETLSQVQAAIRMGATAMLNKPFTQSTVYTTLMMAQGIKERIGHLEDVNRRLTEINRQRPELAKAVAHLMVARCIDEHDAYSAIRSLSMSLNLSIEDVCKNISAFSSSQNYRNI